MKKISCAVLLCMLLVLPLCPAGAAGLSGLLFGGGELPDPAALLGADAFLYDKEVTADGIDYVAFTFPMPKDYGAFLEAYAALAGAAGYSVSAGSILDMDAHRIASGAMSAWLVADYRGALLFLVHPGLSYAPLPTPTPTPQPTPQPTAKPESALTFAPSSGGGHVEYVTIREDCFACTGGVCDLCHGSGWYRLYGERVPCSIYCQTCNGLGYFTITQPVWVP